MSSTSVLASGELNHELLKFFQDKKDLAGGGGTGGYGLINEIEKKKETPKSL